jgi:hypothetical protein
MIGGPKSARSRLTTALSLSLLLLAQAALAVGCSKNPPPSAPGADSSPTMMQESKPKAKPRRQHRELMDPPRMLASWSPPLQHEKEMSRFGHDLDIMPDPEVDRLLRHATHSLR